MENDLLTVLSGCYVKGALNVRLRFGNPRHVQHRGDLVFYRFAPGQRFGYLWWARLSARRQVAGFAIAEALGLGQCGYGLPCVDHAVQVHAYLNCRCIGKDLGVVGHADELIDCIQQSGIDPCLVPPAYYRLASQALRVGHEPRRINRRELFCFLEDKAHAHAN